MAQVTLGKKSVDRLVKKLDTLKRPLTKKGADQLGSVIVREMKKDIGQLKSPISGGGKFKALDPKYKKRKQRLGKGGDPNLKLSGKFLRSLTHASNKLKDGWSTTIKFSNQLSKDKEKGHRDGANGQKKRPIIPTASESFNKRISAIIKAFLNSTVAGIVRRK